jgi:UPF0288 family protein (methanogenesis marker protein 3)
MDSNYVIAGNPQTKLRVQTKSPQRDESAMENDLENRIENLDKLVDSVHVALDHESFSGKRHALDLVNELRVKIKASHNMLRVAKLLSEPARESMLSSVRNCLNDLEGVIALRLGVKFC